MGTNAERSDEPTTVERAESGVRTALTGYPDGNVRRVLLYLATAGLMLTPEPVLAIVPLLMLALTDGE